MQKSGGMTGVTSKQHHMLTWPSECNSPANGFCSSLFFESVTWDETAVGFEHVPGGMEYVNRSVLSLHFYSPPLVSLSRTLVSDQFGA